MCRLMLDEVSEATLPPRCGGVHGGCALLFITPKLHRAASAVSLKSLSRPARVALDCANHCHLLLTVDLPPLPAAD